MADEKAETKSSGKELLSFIPKPWRVPVGVLAILVLVIIFFNGLSKNPMSVNQVPNNGVSVTGDPTPNNPVQNPGTNMGSANAVDISHNGGAAPRAGTPITFTATAENTNDVSALEVWWRQYGDWKITSCASSPCSYTQDSPAVGTHYYLAKLTTKNGATVLSPEAGAYTVDVVSGVQTGDTIAPRIVSFYDPGSPHEGMTVSITASVNDVSGLDNVQIYVDGVVVKTCSQKVKIAQCLYTTNTLTAGVHSFYATAVDTYGNSGQSDAQNITVLP